MDPKLFTEYLPWLKKPHFFYSSKLRGSNWIEENVDSAISRDNKEYGLHMNNRDIDLSQCPASLQRLYAEYDLRHVIMLWTTFWPEPKKLDQGWGFADMSEVNIVVSASDQIEAYAAHPIRGMPGATDCLGVLAKNLELYLEALFCGAMNAHHFISGFPDEDPVLFEKTTLVAKHCALIAGGDEYYPFWAGVLGLPPPDNQVD